MDSINDTITKIKSLEIQGATNIVKESLKSLKQLIVDNPTTSFADFKYLVNLLIFARPTEPFAKNCLNFLLFKIENQQNILEAIQEIESLLVSNEEKIIKFGVPVLQNKNILLTHCHSTGVEKIITAHFQNQKDLQVFCTETRPLFQGRITASHLVEKHIETTLLVDFFSSYLLNQKNIQAVLIGADALYADGSVVNKVGSFSISLSAYTAQIPLYIVSSLLKYSPVDLEIENRPANEVWDNPPPGLKILNPAFDQVPANFITGIITEAGIIKPEEIKNKVDQTYTWITNKT